MNQPMPETGLVGFICPRTNEKVLFEACFACVDHCHPLPLIIALMKRRPVVPNRYSVTEILNPPRIIDFSRRYPYFAKLESLVWGTFGTAWHNVVERSKAKIIELGLGDDYKIETFMEAPISTPAGDITLTGIADLYHVPPKHLWDFKTMKNFAIQKIRSSKSWDGQTYHWQVNLYRRHGFPETEMMLMECIIKDWSEAVQEKYHLKPVETLEIPFIRDEVLDEYVKAKVAYILECEKDPSLIRDCTEEETWFNRNPKSKNFNQHLRCKSYCVISELCPQYQKWLLENKYVTREKSRSTKRSKTSKQAL